MVSHVGEVFHRAGRFVIDDRDAIAAGQQCLDQMAADESRSAGNEAMLHVKAPTQIKPRSLTQRREGAKKTGRNVVIIGTTLSERNNFASLPG